MENITPKIDAQLLQEKANEYAMKGLIKEIEEYYTSYSSPWRKQVQEELKNKTLNFSLELPDVTAMLNDLLTEKMQMIATESINKVIIPDFKRLLTKAKEEMNFSEILTKFVELKNFNDLHFRDNDFEPSVLVEKNKKYDWYEVEISYNDYMGRKQLYEFTMHERQDKDKDENGNLMKKYYKILGNPSYNDSAGYGEKIVIKGEGSIRAEVPMTKQYLSDDFIQFLINIVLAQSKIYLDVDSFEYLDIPMYNCECH